MQPLPFRVLELPTNNPAGRARDRAHAGRRGAAPCALCYLFASLLFLNLRLPGLVVAFVAILCYWALMTFVPVSGIGAGQGPTPKDANLANWIDGQYLPGRKWNGDWDPEGLLSTLPAIGTCLMGTLGSRMSIARLLSCFGSAFQASASRRSRSL